MYQAFASACLRTYRAVRRDKQQESGNSGVGSAEKKAQTGSAASTTIYAGKILGGDMSTDDGTMRLRMTGGLVIKNDVYVDPNQPKHVLLAADRGGALRSDGTSMTYKPSNERHYVAPGSGVCGGPARSLAALCRSGQRKEVGGVCASKDGGVKWRQTNSGLAGRDTYSLADDAGRYAAGRDPAWSPPDDERDVD